MQPYLFVNCIFICWILHFIFATKCISNNQKLFMIPASLKNALKQYFYLKWGVRSLRTFAFCNAIRMLKQIGWVDSTTVMKEDIKTN